MLETAKKIPLELQIAAENKPPAQNWKKELANATTSAHQLLTRLKLESHLDIIDEQPDFRCLTTESFIHKMQPGDINDPLLRQVLPLNSENQLPLQSSGVTDPVGDIAALITPGLLHKYFGRALLISTGACAVHCRYCFRRHYPYQQSASSSNALDETFSYLKQHSEIEEIILSGGDPLVLENTKLKKIITQLESIDHLTTLRIHTRLPIVLPNRINDGLLQLLQDSRFDIVMVIHANHANELQQPEYTKLHRLYEAGIMLLNQSVLLKGINDDADTLIALSKRLFECKTLPYYLHLLDHVSGAMHFEVDKTEALEIKTRMEQKLPGYLVPRLVQENAGEMAKTAIFRI